MGSKSRGPSFDILACQEIGDNPTANGYSLVSVDKPTPGLSVALLLNNSSVNRQASEIKNFKIPEAKHGRGTSFVELSYKFNAKFKVWIASIHCKSGEQFKNVAQMELDNLVKILLAPQFDAPKAIVITGDMNWGSVAVSLGKYKAAHYNSVYFLGSDQMSGKSLMQTAIFYAGALVEQGGIFMKDLAKTSEGHVTLQTSISFK